MKKLLFLLSLYNLGFYTCQAQQRITYDLYNRMLPEHYRLFKTVFLHKQYCGNVEINYFHKAKNATEMNRIIRHTAGLIKYR